MTSDDDVIRQSADQFSRRIPLPVARQAAAAAAH